MSVQRIEEYKQLDGTDILKVYIKPTKVFPQGGYFYCDADAIDLVQSYSWSLHRGTVKNNVDVVAGSNLHFHQEYAKQILGYAPTIIDHINRVELDNCDINLNDATAFKNQRNRPSKGYSRHGKEFQAQLTFNGKHIIIASSKNECLLLQIMYPRRKQYYADYDYNFLSDRNNEFDILDLERTGKISSEEATYRHILKYADNAWYYYKYALEDYFRDNHIPVPSFDLDSQGFMISPMTGERLCPY